MCRHDISVKREDCINCDRDQDAFDAWWQDRLPKDDPQYDFAMDAWLSAIKYLEREEINF